MNGNFNYLIVPGIYYSGTVWMFPYPHVVHISVLAQLTRICNLRYSQILSVELYTSETLDKWNLREKMSRDF